MALFTSALQTITSGGSLSIAHGLGVAPDFVDYRLECQTADQNWSVGDIIRPLQPNPSASAQGAVVVADSTSLNVRFGSGSSVFRAVQNGGTFQPANLTNSSWKVRFIAGTETGFRPASDQSISSAGTFSLTHGLGGTPRSIHFALVCQTAENGYSVGDVVWPCGVTGGTVGKGVVTKLTSTQILGKYLSSGSPIFSGLNKSTGALVSFTNANWKLRPFAYVGGTNYNGISIVAGGAMNNSVWPSTTSYANESFTCSTGELGYSTNDIIALGWFISPSTNAGAAVARSTTSGRYGSGVGSGTFACIRWDTAGRSAMTDNNWFCDIYSEQAVVKQRQEL